MVRRFTRWLSVGLLLFCLLCVQVNARDAEATVEQYGAAGDGVTDDGEAIQAALNSGAAKVIFGKGKTYLYAAPIQMHASGVEIDGNGATLRWADDAQFQTWEELIIIDETRPHEKEVTDIYLHDLNFYTPNVGSENRGATVQLLLYHCRNVRVENCGFLIDEGKANQPGNYAWQDLLPGDGGRGATNIRCYGNSHGITIERCSLKNLSHASGDYLDTDPVASFGLPYWGAGSNICVSGFVDEEGLQSSITDITMKDNYMEKSCHDESIAIWSAEAKRVTITGNEFYLHEQGLLTNYSDMCFTFGNAAETENGGKIDTVDELYFTKNKVYAESRHCLFNTCGGAGSGAVYIRDNDITWVKLDKTKNYCGIIDTARCNTNVFLENNDIRYLDSGEGGYFYKFFPSRRVCATGNRVELNGVLGHLCDIDDDAQYAADTSRFRDNHFIVNTALEYYFYRGYEFCGNTVEFQVPSPNTVFSFYQTDFSKAAKLWGNTVLFHSDCGSGTDLRTPLMLTECRVNGHGIDCTGNTFDTMVPQDPAVSWPMAYLGANKDETEQVIYTAGTLSNLFDTAQVFNDRNAADFLTVNSPEAYRAWEGHTAPVLNAAAADGTLSYTVTGPLLANPDLCLACYDAHGQMLALRMLPSPGHSTGENWTVPDCLARKSPRKRSAGSCFCWRNGRRCAKAVSYAVNGRNAEYRPPISQAVTGADISKARRLPRRCAVCRPARNCTGGTIPERLAISPKC